MDKSRALEVFCAVADAGSLAGAARRLALSPPSVTRILNELETYLGTALLRRTTRQVTLTEVGERYLEDARRILEQLQDADDVARGARVKPTGTLRITASVLFGQLYIAPIVRDYLDAHADVRVECVFVDRVVNLVDEGLDVAVRIGPLPDSSLRATGVGAVRHISCASPDYLAKHGRPELPEDLTRHRTAHATGMHPKGVWTFDGGVTIALAPRLIFSTIAACVAAAEAGWGITRVLSYQIGPQLVAGTLVPVLDEFSTEQWPVNLVYAGGRQQSAKVRAFLDLATDRLRKEPALEMSGQPKQPEDVLSSPAKIP